MKLYDLHEQSGEDFPTMVFRKVSRRLNSGDSLLKKAMKSSGLTLFHVQRAITNGNCMPNPGGKDLGPTYLEQHIANLLRDLVTDNELPITQLNDARKLMGLTVLSSKALKHEKKRSAQGRYGKVKGGQVQQPD